MCFFCSSRSSIVKALLTPGRHLSSLLSKYSAVFKEQLGTITPYKVQLRVKESAKPKFCRARQVPFSFWSEANDELGRQESEGVLKKLMSVSGQHP